MLRLWLSFVVLYLGTSSLSASEFSVESWQANAKQFEKVMHQQRFNFRSPLNATLWGAIQAYRGMGVSRKWFPIRIRFW